jgi:chromosome segregation ATPase
MKPRNFRYAEVASAASAAPGEVTADKLRSILTHENQHLRALVEGRGRITVDRDLQDELDRQAVRITNLQRRLEQVTAERDRMAAREQAVDSELSDLRQLLTDHRTTTEHQMSELTDRFDQREQRVAAEQHAALVDLQQANDRLWEENESLKASLSSLEESMVTARQAETDLRAVLRRLSTSPLAPLLTRRAGYRELEQRWIK